jgi:hypothetical protein
MKKLTKDDILKGKDRSETLVVPGYDAEVVIRPLTDGELGDVFAVIGQIPLNDEGYPDVGKIDPTSHFKALRLAVSLGMTEPHLTPAEVADMKFGVPEFIGMRILELSGMHSGADAKKKR